MFLLVLVLELQHIRTPHPLAKHTEKKMKKNIS
jgi:hypothetical protein